MTPNKKVRNHLASSCTVRRYIAYGFSPLVCLISGNRNDILQTKRSFGQTVSAKVQLIRKSSYPSQNCSNIVQTCPHSHTRSRYHQNCKDPSQLLWPICIHLPKITLMLQHNTMDSLQKLICLPRQLSHVTKQNSFCIYP